MKLYLEDDNGQKIEVQPLQGLDAETDIIIFMSPVRWSKENIRKEERYYTRKLNKRVVIVDGAFSEIYGIAKKEVVEET